MTGNVVEIRNSESIEHAMPTRRIIYMVLLLAVKDQATEVKFEPSELDDVWKLRYQVGGVWEDLAPFPLHFPILREFRHLTATNFVYRSLLQLRRLLIGRRDYPTMEVRPIRSIIAGQPVEVVVSLHRTGRESPALDSVGIRLPCDYIGSEKAEQILRDYLQRRHPSNEQ